MFENNSLTLGNPAGGSNSSKYNWSNVERGNVTNINGLSNFNSVIKRKIKYLYLNNNKFPDINALNDFSNIEELELMCNPNLSNINGIENHSTIKYLTLQLCALSSLGNYDSETNKYSNGLTGCSGLVGLSFWSNRNLQSLVGIESALNLQYLVASDCNLLEVNSLKNHSKIICLDLGYNRNLENVKYIQHCKALKYIYLSNNEKMIMAELNIALNGSDSTIGTTVLISNCVNGYQNIPKKYWDLFYATASKVDFSYATLGEYLYNNSAKWISLINKTNINMLNLSGQQYLTMNDTSDGKGIITVLSTLSGMKSINLSGITNLNSISFVDNMPNLIELGLMNVNASLTNLSSLNSCRELKALIVNNPNIDVTKIIDVFNRFKNTASGDGELSWFAGNKWDCSGYCCPNDCFPDFSKATGINYFRGGNMIFTDISDCVLDLSGTSITGFYYYRNSPSKMKLPKNVQSVLLDNAINVDVSFSGDGKSVGLLLDAYWMGANTLSCLANSSRFENLIFNSGARITSNLTLPSGLITTCNTIRLSHDKGFGIDLVNFTKNGNLEKFCLSGMKFVNNIENLGNLTSLTELNLQFSGINNINFCESLTNLEVLNLNNNSISDISSLSNLTKLENEVVLSNNNITDLTPLVTAIGTDNKIEYFSLWLDNNALDGYSVADNITALLKLHQAGLQNVYISGNNFSTNEINELINGKTVTNADGTKTVYAGFGSGHVSY